MALWLSRYRCHDITVALELLMSRWRSRVIASRLSSSRYRYRRSPLAIALAQSLSRYYPLCIATGHSLSVSRNRSLALALALAFSLSRIAYRCRDITVTLELLMSLWRSRVIASRLSF